MDGKCGENDSGELHLVTAQQKGNRVISEDLLPAVGSKTAWLLTAQHKTMGA